MSKNITLLRAFTILVCIWISLTQIVSCARQSYTPAELSDWTRVEKVSGCASYSSNKGEPYDMNIRPNKKFESLLLSYIQDKKIEPPSCWYERPDGSIFLHAGEYCGFPKEAYFRKAGSGWVLDKFGEVFVQCDLKST